MSLWQLSHCLLQEKRSLLDQLQENKRAKDESVQEIICELKSLQQQDNRRLLKVKLNWVFLRHFY